MTNLILTIKVCQNDLKMFENFHLKKILFHMRLREKFSTAEEPHKLDAVTFA